MRAIVFIACIAGCASGAAATPAPLATNVPTRAAPSVSASAAPSASASPSAHAIAFEVRRASFAVGDDVRIEAVLSERDDFVEGGSYVVRGRYTLRSRARAQLALFSTSGESAVTPDKLVVDAGSGAFEFRVVVRRAGYLRVSFYPVDGGEGFGGATFGRGTPAHRRHAAAPAASSSAPSVHLPPSDMGRPED